MEEGAEEKVASLNPPLLAPRMWERGHEPKNAGSLHKMEKEREWILLWTLQRGTEHC